MFQSGLYWAAWGSVTQSQTDDQTSVRETIYPSCSRLINDQCRSICLSVLKREEDFNNTISMSILFIPVQSFYFHLNDYLLQFSLRHVAIPQHNSGFRSCTLHCFWNERCVKKTFTLVPNNSNSKPGLSYIVIIFTSALFDLRLFNNLVSIAKI
jgi:hypothetical protein